MVDQDPHSGSVTGDSGHGTRTATGEDESINNIKEPAGAVGDVDVGDTSQVSNGEMMSCCLCLMMIMS